MSNTIDREPPDYGYLPDPEPPISDPTEPPPTTPPTNPPTGSGEEGVSGVGGGTTGGSTVPVSSIDYPSNFPCPSRSQHNVQYAFDIQETKSQCGWIRRRLREPYKYKRANIAFVMSSTEFWQWQTFVHDHAFKWITMPMVTDNVTSTMSEPITERETIRFISSVSYSYSDWSVITATVEVEFYIDPGRIT